MDYKFVDFSFFKSSESWISSNEKSKIKGKDLKTLEKISVLKKTTLFGGNEEFKGGLFIKDDRLLFFKNGMYYCSGSYDFWNGLNKCDYFLIDYNLDNSTVIKTYTRNNNNLKKERTIKWGDIGNTEFVNHIKFLKESSKGFIYERYYTGSKLKFELIIKNKFIHECLQFIRKDKLDFIKNKKNQDTISETRRIEKLKTTITSTISRLDKDNNGIIDLIEDKNVFNLLLKKHQKVVIEKGKEFNQNYTHQFIKVGNYIKQKRSNLQLIFDCIKQVQNQQDLDEYVEILENEIHSYNLLLINSLNLIVSLIEDDQITFYDIYEKFDKLNIYNSNWENEISQKLTTLNKGISELNSNIKGLMYEIRDMGDRIVNSIEDLSYITKESTRMLDSRLGEIDSSIKTNNLLTLIQTYQTYKINKNTKSLRG